MPVFVYEAIDMSGKKLKGELFGESELEVTSSLRNSGLYPLAVKVKKEQSEDGRSSRDIFKRRVGKKSIAIFARQFSSMLQAGIPLPVIFEVLVKQERNDSFKEILLKINEDILAGNTLSSSLAKFDVFPNLFVSMAAVGEANGRLDLALGRVADNMEKELKLASKIRSAMIYPAVLLTVSILTSVVLTFVVLPTFTKMFGDMGIELPGTTLAFANLSQFMRRYWYMALATIIICVLAVMKLLKEPILREKLGRLLLSMPMIGKVQNAVLMSRFCSVISSLTDSGVDIVTSLETMRNVVGNYHVKNIFLEITGIVQSGSTLSAAASRFGVFPPLVVSMLKVGEESGSLADVLSRTAVMYEEEADERLKKLAAMVEPAVTVIMALVIGFIVLSIVQPMFEMYRHFR